MKAKQVATPIYLLLIPDLLTINCTSLLNSKEKRAKSLFSEGIESTTLLSPTISTRLAFNTRETIP